MKKNHAVWYFPVFKFPRKTMREMLPEMTITVRVQGSSPQPTRIGFLYLIPKAFGFSSFSAVVFGPRSFAWQWMNSDFYRVFVLESIANIIALRTKFQVGRIAARRKIALVPNYKPRRDRAIVQFVSDAMGETRLASNVDASMPATHAVPKPFPTIVGAALAYFLPEAFDVFGGILRMHQKSFSGVKSQGVRAPLGQLVSPHIIPQIGGAF
jgi:hypothetical protein